VNNSVGNEHLNVIVYIIIKVFEIVDSDQVSDPNTELEASQDQTNGYGIGYSRILIPHDGSEKSDKALGHAIYISKLSGAEIIILNVIEHVKKTDSSALIATSSGGQDGSTVTDEKLEVTIYGGVKHMVEEKIKYCKQAGVKSQISYKIQTGRSPLEEIVEVAQAMNVDLIIMASSKITGSIKVHGSVTRKVIDSTNKPVLVIHEQK
jgi:nucleotide-binding universal stress UspA family protein